MSHSNSSLNTFANCMAKYEHSYVLHTPPCKPPSIHLTFGAMAHEVLQKAGELRDEVAGGVVDTEQYYNIIPSEVLYRDLKNEFCINNWEMYFTPIIKQTAEYEQELIQQLINTNSGPVSVEREVKLQLTVDELNELGIRGITQPIVGVIDLLLYTNTHAIIIDYKFSTTRKTQDDFDINSQLPLYSLLVHLKYDIPLHNIQYGYIDIPKKAFDKPLILSSGKLSRNKQQNISQEAYKKAVEKIHGKDDPYYNCKPNGYYYECWCNMALNKAAYMSIQYLDINVYSGVITDLINTAKMIDFMSENEMIFLKKYDSYSCVGCEYINACKPWLTVCGE